MHLTHFGGNEYGRHRHEGHGHENDFKTEQNVYDLYEVRYVQVIPINTAAVE